MCVCVYVLDCFHLSAESEFVVCVCGASCLHSLKDICYVVCLLCADWLPICYSKDLSDCSWAIWLPAGSHQSVPQRCPWFISGAGKGPCAYSENSHLAAFYSWMGLQEKVPKTSAMFICSNSIQFKSLSRKQPHT